METKNNINFISNNFKNDNLKNAEKVFSKMIQSDESKFGIKSFMEKKKPNWNEFYNSKL
jgi:hypothetical protein